MKKILINLTALSAFITLLSLTSCSKSKDIDSSMPDNKCDYLKEMIIIDYFGKGMVNSTITYDSKGRVIFVQGEGKNKAAYRYTSNTIELDATDIFGEVEKKTYQLDQNGRITGSSYYNYQCKYDSEGHLIEYRAPSTYNDEIVGYVHFKLSYENGNLTKIAREDLNYAIYLTYYEDKPAQEVMGYLSPLYQGGIIGDRNQFYLIQAGFFGKGSKNLIRSRTDGSNGYPMPDFRYQFDSKGRVIKYGDNYAYKYQCD